MPKISFRVTQDEFNEIEEAIEESAVYEGYSQFVRAAIRRELTRGSDEFEKAR